MKPWTDDTATSSRSPHGSRPHRVRGASDRGTPTPAAERSTRADRIIHRAGCAPELAGRPPESAGTRSPTVSPAHGAEGRARFHASRHSRAARHRLLGRDHIARLGLDRPRWACAETSNNRSSWKSGRAAPMPESRYSSCRRRPSGVPLSGAFQAAKARNWATTPCPACPAAAAPPPRRLGWLRWSLPRCGRAPSWQRRAQARWLVRGALRPRPGRGWREYWPR
jgi:hypothetical protein